MREKKGPKLRPLAAPTKKEVASAIAETVGRGLERKPRILVVEEEPSRRDVGRPAGTTPAAVVVANRFDDLEPHEREEFDELVKESGLKSERAKRALALDFVMHGRLLAQIEARAKEECSLLDDAKHRNAAVSNRRRILETLKVLAGAKEKTIGEEMAEAEAAKAAAAGPSSPPTAPPAPTSSTVAIASAEDLLNP